MKTLIIVPAYNEEESIGATLTDLLRYDFYDILVVDDGSRDGTAAVCRERNVRCISLPFNMGLSGAFETGMRYAFLNGYDAALQFDADGQHKAEYIKALLDSIASGSDIAIGSRFLGLHADRNMRQLGASFIRAGIRLTTGQRISDPTSGMRAYSGRIIELFANSCDMTPEPDTLVFLMRHGVRVSEVQVTMAQRLHGESYLNPWSSMKYMLRMAISIFLIQFARPELRLKEAATL